jgi:phosphoglucosamine mutase
MMRAGGMNLGGESSGHILMTSLCPSGDGLIAALQMLHILSRATKPASETFHMFAPKCQRLENLRDMDGAILERQMIRDALARIETDMGNAGRILVRPSGTEPLVRVMVEADTEELLQSKMDEVILLLQDESNKTA